MTDKVVLYKGPGTISFRGRAQRREWLIGFGVNTLIGTVIGALSSIGPVLALPWTIAVLAVTSRRLHDLGRSGWLQVVPMIIFAAVIGAYFLAERLGVGGKSLSQATAILGDAAFTTLVEKSQEVDTAGAGALDKAFMVALVISAAIYGLFYVWLASSRGTPEANCYGEVD